MPCALRESTRSSHGLTSLSIASSSLLTTPLSLSLVGLRDACSRDEGGELCSSHTFLRRTGPLLRLMGRQILHHKGSACVYFTAMCGSFIPPSRPSTSSGCHAALCSNTVSSAGTENKSLAAPFRTHNVGVSSTSTDSNPPVFPRQIHSSR